MEKTGSIRGAVSEVKRLEELWAGPFGDAYNQRNKNSYEGRGVFWREMLAGLHVQSVLEVGCNVGGNLRWIAGLLPPRQVWGVDINEEALKKLRAVSPGINAVRSPARELPFRDGGFDLVFTAGVLIHHPGSILKKVMSEIVRCSRRYVLCMEYFSARTLEVPYRGNERALFKRDYGKIYARSFPRLELVRRGELNKAQGWDNVTYWLFKIGKR